MRLHHLPVIAAAALGCVACSTTSAPARNSTSAELTSASAATSTSAATSASAANSTTAGPTPTPTPSGAPTKNTSRPARTSSARATSAHTSPAPTPSRHSSSLRAAATSSRSASPTAATHRIQSGSSLPLSMSTGSARQVITVVASSQLRTVATLQRWSRQGSGWVRVGSAVTAHLGSDGLSTHPSESRSATPIGSFTLTHAFGHDADPGSGLPYTRTDPSYWWVSEAGSLYNTMRSCTSSCGFRQGSPNEHLYYETPYYDYAAVIDYNTPNSPGGVQQGAGSAFFLHVTDGGPTAGCVSIPLQSVVTVLRWLSPAQHPRILIGVGR